MFKELKLIMELHANKDNPEKLREIFINNREQVLNLKQKYPQWKSYVDPQVVEELRKLGLPVD